MRLLQIVILTIYIKQKSLEKFYKDDWTELATRPLPQWYHSAKVGIFVHWGLYSVPGFLEGDGTGSEWFWYRWMHDENNCQRFMAQNYRLDYKYQDFVPMFTADSFNPEEWAQLFVNSGAKFVVLTAKHHDGFNMFPSLNSRGWDSYNQGPMMDIVKVVSEAVRAAGLRFGVYYSLYEWFNDWYIEDYRNDFRTDKFINNKTMPDIEQLIFSYNASVLWSDGDWDASDTYWRSKEILAWLYNLSPVRDEIVVNDRWGRSTLCRVGDFLTCNDKFNPGYLMTHKWENAFPIDRWSWGFRRNMKITDVLKIGDILNNLVSTVSCGGNVLINVGPTREGIIIPIFQERLLQLGAWLKVNGEAIYDTSPWIAQRDGANDYVWYTCKNADVSRYHPLAKPKLRDRISVVYAMFLIWPTNNILTVKDLTSYLLNGDKTIELLASQSFEPLEWSTIDSERVEIYLPNNFDFDEVYAWTLAVRTAADVTTKL